jgi:acetoin utilization protein AcuB
MRVQDVMTKDVQTISPMKPADEAWDLMRARGIHHLVVMDESRIVGVVSDRDIGGRLGGPLRRNRIVSELMSNRVVTAHPDTTVRRAANLMRGRSVGCLVVARENRPVGVVTVSDLLRLVGRGAERPVVATPPRRLINHRVPHRKRNRAMGAW